MIGTNAPQGKIRSSGWGVAPLGNYGGDTSLYVMDFGNALAFGSQSTGNIPIGANLKPEEAWNVDTKLDDGRPGYGKVVPRDAPTFGNAAGCTTSTSNTDYTGTYRLNNSANACSLFFPKAF